MLRTEDPRLLRGQGEFVDDIRLPGLLHAAFVRASLAHARIRRIDAGAALNLKGVHTVLTSADMPRVIRERRIPMLVPNPQLKSPMTPFCLAVDEVCYVGEPVAIVVAETRHIAEDAAALIEIDYEPLGAISDCRDAVKPNAPPEDWSAARTANTPGRE